ncbi:MAG: hypothetical protein RhofKO_01570 [Rhodothermales bacterium]
MLLVSCASGPSVSDAPSSAPTGHVTTSDGQPLPGSLVTAFHPDNGSSVTVRTDGEGSYMLPSSIDASYTLQAHLLGFESSEVVTSAEAAVDFVLQPAADVRATVPSSMYLNRLPDGLEKRDFTLDCTGCHQFNRVRGMAGPLQRPKSAWKQWTSVMLSFAGANSGFPIMAPSRDADETAAWLTRHLGAPDTPIDAFEAPAPTAPDEQVVITEYPIPNA